MQNYFKIFPQTIAGEKVNLIILDDASDPGKGVSNARRFVKRRDDDRQLRRSAWIVARPTLCYAAAARGLVVRLRTASSVLVSRLNCKL